MWLISFVLVISIGSIPSHVESWRLLDGRIVGGHDADIKDYSYQGSFQVYGFHYCGVTLYRPNVVITAAHCTNRFLGSERYINIHAGSNLVSEGGQSVAASKICQHPQFNTQTLDNDVAVILLNGSFELGPTIEPIPLYPLREKVENGALANVTGWGVLAPGQPVSPRLQVVTVPKIGPTKCKKMYEAFNETVTERMICFGYTEGGKDACQGDSGGPLVINRKLVGIVSWGVGCAKPKAPGVYTKIANPKIRQHINRCLKDFGL